MADRSAAIHSFLTAEGAEKNAEKTRFLTAEDAEGAEKNAEKTSGAIDTPSPIRSLVPSVFVSAPSASSAVRIFSLEIVKQAFKPGSGLV